MILILLIETKINTLNINVCRINAVELTKHVNELLNSNYCIKLI